MKRRVFFETIIDGKGLADICPIEAGEEQCGAVQSYGPRTRDYYLLHYVTSGQGVYKTEKKTYKVGAGEIFVIFPDEITTYSSLPSDPWRYSWVGFTSQLDLSKALSSHVITAPECESVFHSIARYSDIGLGREMYVCGKVFELLGLLSSQYNYDEDRDLRYVRLARNFIETRYYDKIKVEEIAKMLNLDRTYFSKIFQRHVGKSPQQYIVDFRLNTAAYLLIRKGLSPGEAASHVGYSDVFNFSRMFRRKFDMSPSQYKKAKKHEAGGGAES